MKYLASPYTHKDPAVMQDRYERVVNVQTKLLDDGHPIFCPIAQSHVAQLKMTAPFKNDASFWLDEIDIPVLGICDELFILTLPGWRDSYGVHQEWLAALDVPHMFITYIDEDCNKVKV